MQYNSGVLLPTGKRKKKKKKALLRCVVNTLLSFVVYCMVPEVNQSLLRHSHNTQESVHKVGIPSYSYNKTTISCMCHLHPLFARVHLRAATHFIDRNECVAALWSSRAGQRVTFPNQDARLVVSARERRQDKNVNAALHQPRPMGRNMEMSLGTH